MKIQFLVLGVTICGLSACGMLPSQRKVVPPLTVEVTENAVPGTVTETWEEPMYDTVRVPAQLDPTGTYFRPSHRTVVEIRPGRYQEVQYPPDSRSSGQR